ncbi:hypothetical protein K661_01800 [Piscirickettsia salmonis LF-89 = ATCC VR-1361]|nr:hypothetical protein K661_01800 [Piscirickettsia salmonis LF-89 = ATCC VR-1361]
MTILGYVFIFTTLEKLTKDPFKDGLIITENQWLPSIATRV